MSTGQTKHVENQPTVISFKNFNLENVVVGAPKKTKQGTWTMPIKYRHADGKTEELLLQTPKQRCPFGIANAPEKYRKADEVKLGMSLDMGDDTNRGVVMMREKLAQFDQLIMKEIHRHQDTLFSSEKSFDTIKDNYAPCIKAKLKDAASAAAEAAVAAAAVAAAAAASADTDKKKKKVAAAAPVPPPKPRIPVSSQTHFLSFSVKMKMYANECRTKILREDGTPLEFTDVERNSMVSCIIRPVGVWFALNGYGISWRAEAVRVSPRREVRGLEAFLPDSDDEAEKKVDSDEEDSGDESGEESDGVQVENVEDSE